MLRWIYILVFITVFGLTGCADVKTNGADGSVDTNEEKRDATFDETNMVETIHDPQANDISKEKEEKIVHLVKSYVEHEVSFNLKELKKMSKGQAEERLPTRKNYDKLESFVSIDMFRINDEYHVRVVFEATPKGKEIITRNQRDFRVKEIDGTFYIVSVSRTV